MRSHAPSSRARLRERQREDTRQRIYDAALVIFRRDGFDAARVDDITQAAGVSHGTFYFHFATKDEVLVQYLRASEARVVEAIEQVPADHGLTAALEATCASIATQWEGDPQMFRDVGLVAMRYLFKGEAAQIAAGEALAAADPKSLTSAALVGRFRVASERDEVTRLLPPHVLADLFLMNVFAATLSWCAAPATRPLGMMLAGVIQLFLDGARRTPK